MNHVSLSLSRTFVIDIKIVCVLFNFSNRNKITLILKYKKGEDKENIFTISVLHSIGHHKESISRVLQSDVFVRYFTSEN